MSSDLSVELTAPNGHKYTQPTGLFINNDFVKSKSGEKITSINPTDEKEIASVYAAGAADVDDAVAAARNAFKTWRDVVPTERGALMLKLADLGKSFLLLSTRTLSPSSPSSYAVFATFTTATISHSPNSR